ncbi:beta-galactosidase [Anaerosporobacter sp.]|uniref:beta-galactosidase n=1 Tax=Anaerosporobacter sp. TaxID=1872529 RepID=UPI00286EBA13|nr:beta-galactosidase [Anaerosporobacter sp.]
MENKINLTSYRKRERTKLSDKFYGKDPSGKELSFTNYYMEMNGKPFFGITGECHFSRVHENQWEDTILKMKMGGINIIATYMFWIHHEEIEGQFRFDGNRNIRKFIELCKKHNMYVIVRIGPFDHGEVRNGGLPDWMYGKPFEVRSNNEGFLAYTKILYHKFAEQFDGLYFKDGGPIIGAQIENEYMHSAAPWEMTTGVTNEWVPGGSDGVEYMKILKKMAQDEGICTPFYTCTGWGGAATPTDEMLPLWGGYAFWPWIFYDYSGEHPATPEYIYRDNHNNQVPKTYNFEPTYEPESFPYACCEMGGGMSLYYNYRFQLPYESVDAMANIKLASGCNFLGYYMYRGGSNPKGEKTPYMNECQCPKISYDYQAALGEYGQVRPSYHRLRALHTFVGNYQDRFCDMETVLPENSQDIKPEDVETLRYAIRTDGKSGFLFLNNYQDHMVCKRKENEKITIVLPEEEIVIDHISLEAGEEAVFPFKMDVDGFCLNYAKAQPLSIIRTEERNTYIFFAPEGVTPEYVWDGNGIEMIDGKAVHETCLSISQPADEMSSYQLSGNGKEVEIITLTREQSLNFYEIEVKGQKTAVLCNSPLLYDGKNIRVENSNNMECVELFMYPSCELKEVMGDTVIREVEENGWKGIVVQWGENKPESRKLDSKQVGPSRYTVQIPETYEKCKDALMQIMYKGNIAQAFINGEMISDNFSNQAVWEIGLKEVWKPEMNNEITILITPIKGDVKIDVSSTMAGRMEVEENSIAELESVEIKPVLEAVLEII